MSSLTKLGSGCLLWKLLNHSSLHVNWFFLFFLDRSIQRRIMHFLNCETWNTLCILELVVPRAPESSSQLRKRESMATKIKSPSKTQLIRGGMVLANHVLTNRILLRMSTCYLCLSYSKRVTYSNFQRSDALKRWERQMIPTSIYIIGCWENLPRTDVLHALIDPEVLKIRLEQKKVTANMTATSPIQFGQNFPLAPTGVVPIPKRKLRVINTDPHNQREKGLLPVPTPQGEMVWVHPDIVESQQ